MNNRDCLTVFLKSVGFFIGIIGVSILASMVLAQTPNLLIVLAPREGTRDSKQQAITDCDGTDNKECFKFICPSNELKTCIKLFFHESHGISSKVDEPLSEGTKITLRALSSKKGMQREFVVANIQSIPSCGAGNCPMMVMRRVNPITWERIVNDWGISVDSFDVAGMPEPCISVDTSGGSCELLVTVYEPIGSTYQKTFCEIINTCRNKSSKRRVATQAGHNYAKLTCPNLSEPPVNILYRPEFTTESFLSDSRYSFSMVRGECKGWPESDKINNVFIIFDDQRGGIPVASGYGIGWRGTSRDSWHLFAAESPDDILEPLVDPLIRADGLVQPSACHPDRCYQVVRWIAPGIVTINWYHQTSNPLRAVRSDILLVPEVLEYP